MALDGSVGLDKAPEVEWGATVIAGYGKLNIFVGANTSSEGAVALQGRIDGEVATDTAFVLFDGREVHAGGDVGGGCGIYNGTIVGSG